MKNKTFDCVEMKHKAAAQIYKEIKGMTLKQELLYWEKQTEILRQRILRKKAKSRSSHLRQAVI